MREANKYTHPLRDRARILIPALVLMIAASATAHAKPDWPGHPRLVMTPTDVSQMRQSFGKTPLFDATLAAVQAEVDAEIQAGIDTPLPQDYSGGYTHERHKKNYAIAQQAGALYQILGDERYAVYVRDMLLQYAAMYGDLPLHPKPRSYARGKLFWQCLNDANWLVFMSQAYDAIYTVLSDEERAYLETELFRPFADHISVNSPQFFNRIHNHSTWGTAAVGMIGLAIGDDELVQRALYGLDIDNFSDARDNDGGFIRQEGQKAGFFANLDNAFSPDGYYTEGPYYQRYAMYPYLVFAQSLRNANYPEQAFARNDAVLLDAVQTLVQLSDQDGDFFPLNDAQKGMSLHARELVTAVDIAFQASGNQALLGIAEMQGRVLLDGAGFATAAAIASGDTRPFEKTSVRFTDGRTGTEGGLAILRSADGALSVLFKYTAHGLSHGHYDKLSYSVYDQGEEVLQDYGMARFVNLGQKGGGNYLPENNSWAKQTVAHNTLVVNATSHFNGQYDIGSQHHSVLDFFSAANRDAQVVSAYEHNAYPDAPMHRTLALLNIEGFAQPVLLDILDVKSATTHMYDLPFHYFGQIIDTSFTHAPDPATGPLGKKAGYQHLRVEARGRADSDTTRFTWMDDNRLYTLTSVAEDDDELILARLGANDPHFNLRRDPVFMIRRRAANSRFISVLEPHGRYDPVTELAATATSQIKAVQVIANTPAYLAVSITTLAGDQYEFVLAHAQAGAKTRDMEKSHTLRIGDRVVSWTGPYHYAQVARP